METRVGDWIRMTDSNLVSALALVASLLAAGCGNNGSAYLKPAPAVSMFNAQSLKDPTNTVLIIYNHDSAGEDTPDRCQA